MVRLGRMQCTLTLIPPGFAGENNKEVEQDKYAWDSGQDEYDFSEAYLIMPHQP